MPGADQVRGIYANQVLREGPIGKLSALLALEARPSTDEDTCSQLWLEQPEGVPVRNWRRSSGDPTIAVRDASNGMVIRQRLPSGTESK
jgi:hypothetical protein